MPTASASHVAGTCCSGGSSQASTRNRLSPLSGTPVKKSCPSSTSSSSRPLSDVTRLIVLQLVDVDETEDLLHGHDMLVSIGKALVRHDRRERLLQRLDDRADAVVREDDEAEAGLVELAVRDRVVGRRHADERDVLGLVPAVGELEHGDRVGALVVDEDPLGA